MDLRVSADLVCRNQLARSEGPRGRRVKINTCKKASHPCKAMDDKMDAMIHTFRGAMYANSTLQGS